MSFETDAPIRTTCPSCDLFVETEGYGIPGYVLDENRVVHHAKCRPDLCTHENSLVMDWDSDGLDDTVTYRMKCRECGTYWHDERVGAQLRAEGEQDEEDDGE